MRTGRRPTTAERDRIVEWLIDGVERTSQRRQESAWISVRWRLRRLASGSLRPKRLRQARRRLEGSSGRTGECNDERKVLFDRGADRNLDRKRERM